MRQIGSICTGCPARSMRRTCQIPRTPCAMAADTRGGSGVAKVGRTGDVTLPPAHRKRSRVLQLALSAVARLRPPLLAAIILAFTPFGVVSHAFSALTAMLSCSCLCKRLTTSLSGIYSYSNKTGPEGSLVASGHTTVPLQESREIPFGHTRPVFRRSSH